MSVGIPGPQSLTIEDLPKLVAAVAAVDPDRVALSMVEPKSATDDSMTSWSLSTPRWVGHWGRMPWFLLSFPRCCQS